MENNYGVGLYSESEGVFYFTNPGLYKMKNRDGIETKDFTALWNNKEYIFKEKTTNSLVIGNEPPQSIQHIRKVFAEKYAQGWFHQTKKYTDLVKKGGYVPATYDEETELKDVIQACLTPLPKGKIEIKELPKDDEKNYKASRAIKSGQDLNKAFSDYEVPELGVQ